jgi:transposase
MSIGSIPLAGRYLSPSIVEGVRSERLEAAPANYHRDPAGSRQEPARDRPHHRRRPQDHSQRGPARHWGNFKFLRVATGPHAQIPPPWPPAAATLSPSACEPYRAFITEQLRLRRNYTAIYQDLVDRFSFAAGYNSVKRFAGVLVAREPEQFDRLEFTAGEEVQVDYGEGAMTRVPGTDRYRRPRLFVMTLRYSRRSFRRVVWESSQQTWARLHEQAWRYFGGSCTYVVLDNLKEGVIKPDLYEPELNPVYRDVLAHYGVVADPARVRDPNRKGTVENAIQHTQSTALKGRRFETIEEQNAFLEQWETRWAAPRIHGATSPSANAPSPTTPASASTTAAMRRDRP